jgi:hypothetical protein
LHAEQFADKQGYPWFLRIESVNEETGAFEGYCMYPSISEAARISCSGTVDIVEEDSSGCIGVLKFAEGSFVSGFEDHQTLVERSSVGSLKLYRIPPGGQYTLSMGGHNPGKMELKNALPVSVVNGRGAYWTRETGERSDAFFNDVALLSGKKDITHEEWNGIYYSDI